MTAIELLSLTTSLKAQGFTADQITAMLSVVGGSPVTASTATVATSTVKTKKSVPAKAIDGLFYKRWPLAIKSAEAGTPTIIFKIAKATYEHADPNTLTVSIADIKNATGLEDGQIAAKCFNCMMKDMSHCDGIYFESCDKKAGTVTWRPESYDTVKKYFAPEADTEIIEDEQ